MKLWMMENDRYGPHGLMLFLGEDDATDKEMGHVANIFCKDAAELTLMMRIIIMGCRQKGMTVESVSGDALPNIWYQVRKED